MKGLDLGHYVLNSCADSALYRRLRTTAGGHHSGGR